MQENQAREAAEKFVALYYDRLDKHRHVSQLMRLFVAVIIQVAVLTYLVMVFSGVGKECIRCKCTPRYESRAQDSVLLLGCQLYSQFAWETIVFRADLYYADVCYYFLPFARSPSSVGRRHKILLHDVKSIWFYKPGPNFRGLPKKIFVVKNMQNLV